MNSIAVWRRSFSEVDKVYMIERYIRLLLLLLIYKYILHFYIMKLEIRYY